MSARFAPCGHIFDEISSINRTVLIAPQMWTTGTVLVVYYRLIGHGKTYFFAVQFMRGQGVMLLATCSLTAEHHASVALHDAFLHLPQFHSHLPGSQM
jgi:hypothetical protein